MVRVDFIHDGYQRGNRCGQTHRRGKAARPLSAASRGFTIISECSDRIGKALQPASFPWCCSGGAAARASFQQAAEPLLDRRPLAIDDREVDRVPHTARGGGSTRYANVEPLDRRLEIGWTWLASAHQRTGANTEAKLLLLMHAFETLGAIRVELKTDALNETSRRAILRLGATEEGTLRKHKITAGAAGVVLICYLLFTFTPRRPLRKHCRIQGLTVISVAILTGRSLLPVFHSPFTTLACVQ